MKSDVEKCTKLFNTRTVKNLMKSYWQNYAVENNINAKGYRSKEYKNFTKGVKKGFIRSCKTRKNNNKTKKNKKQ